MRLPILLAALAAALPLAPAGTAKPAPDPVIAAAGDIACEPGSPVIPEACHQRRTSDILVRANLAAVLALGDNQYDFGELADFNAVYDRTWGRVKAITRPVPGNHEYGSGNADGYFAYFGARAGPAGKGYYSFDVGRWHLIALNSNCFAVGGCDAGSPQERWLRRDLAAHPATCTLAYWHHPLFSSGSTHGGDTAYRAFWVDLYAANADVVLAGHEHNYERFAPQSPLGTADPARGIREFVVGTGGRSTYPFGTPRPNSRLRKTGIFGVLTLVLHPTSYEWRFVSETGTAFTDAGSARCH